MLLARRPAVRDDGDGCGAARPLVRGGGGWATRGRRTCGSPRRACCAAAAAARRAPARGRAEARTAAGAGDATSGVGLAIAESLSESEDLTVDHKVECVDEALRIFEVGGLVTRSLRVNGRLAMSRAFGNAALRHYISVEPSLSGVRRVHEWSGAVAMSGNVWDRFDSAAALQSMGAWAGEYVVVACDGLWDDMNRLSLHACFSRLLASILAWCCPTPGEATATYGRRVLCRLCGALRDVSYSLGSEDNISVAICRLS